MREDMTLADVEKAFRLNLITCMNAFGVADIPVLQHFDYLKKGRRDKAIYFTVLNPRKLGNAYRKYAPAGLLAGHNELQHMQADIQITVVSDDDPLELAMNVTMVVGSLPFIELLRADGVGIQSLSDFVTVHAKDDKDDYTLECTANLPVTFNRTAKPATPLVHDYELTTIKGV